MDGGELIARFLKANHVDVVFTLIGGHISPLLVGAKREGIRVIDTRHEVNAVFAADAYARLTGKVGVAAVTAGPGLTNTITAVRNALMAETPLVLFGGATATALKGRGALQDIDQKALMKSNVKKVFQVQRFRQILPTLEEAFFLAQQKIPGPVFVELPVDLLYDEEIVRKWYLEQAPKGKSLAAMLLRGYLKFHLWRLFAFKPTPNEWHPIHVPKPVVSRRRILKAKELLQKAEKPLLLIGSQALSRMSNPLPLQKAIEKIGAPVYLSGMARGLLGKSHPLQLRQRRKEALREADLIFLLGVPADFRLNYGAHINRKAVQVNVNLSRKDLYLNKAPDYAFEEHPGEFLLHLGEIMESPLTRDTWLEVLRAREKQREEEIKKEAQQKTRFLNPVAFFLKAKDLFPEKTIFVADGGDFVATASYILEPGGPYCWLDPGVFGTLGVGAGFALGAKLAKPDHEVVILYGDGSCAYSLLEFDTFDRHKIPIAAIIGNDACWMQIYRDQVEILKDDVGCMLKYSDYHEVVKPFHAQGSKIDKEGQIALKMAELKRALKARKSYVLNVLLGKSDFRKGSISM
ncbi:MAG: thiamine pyrophosphate-binding protein [Leptospiraceae bacterium]|nr:thiamine pyrophosphate-binding protein [Leptospiraceae bacterium]MDW8306268.1 thiamine pyrophosphate-binding protein [Leptospiraceae bacterium]